MLKLVLLYVCAVLSFRVKASYSHAKTLNIWEWQDENARQKRSDDLGPLDAVVSGLSQDVQTLKAQLQAAENTIATLQSEKGSTFIRWGRPSCPNGSQTLYSGFAGGSDVHDPGSGSSRLCLSPDPAFDQTVVMGSTARLTGAQYYISGHEYTDILCAMCHTSRSTTFMVPGTNRCPATTVLQYTGYLTASERAQEAASDHVCMDAQPEDHPGSNSDERPSAFFEHVVTDCAGSLACPPYQNNKVVTCAVCSK